MKRQTYVFIVILISGYFFGNNSFADKGPTDPMSKDSWTINFGIGYNINYAQVGMIFKLK